MTSPRPSASEHPDAKLVVRSLSSTSMELELHTADGVALAPFGPIHLEREPDKFFKEFFSEIQGLSGRYGTSQGAHRELEDLGAELSKRLLPFELAQLLTEVRGGGSEPRTLWIQSDEPWIPWELLRLPSSAGDRGFQGPFFGEAFAMARWLRMRPPNSHLTPYRSLPLYRLAVVAPHDRKLDSVEGEVAFLIGLRDQAREVERIPADEDSVREALAQGRHDAWHFSGHGLPSDEPGRAEILFGNNQCLRSRSLYAGMLESRHPLVFLNACHTGLTGFSLTGIGGWAEGFLSAGAGAFLGAYWEIEDAPATRFTKVFYTAFLEGLRIAAAVRRARLAIRDEFPGDPTWLAYTLYAHPLAVQEKAREVSPKVPIMAHGNAGDPAERSTRRPIAPQPRPSKRSPQPPRLRPAALLVAALLAIFVAAIVATRFWPSALPSVVVLNPFNETGANGENWRGLAASELLRTAMTFDGHARAVFPDEVFRQQLERGYVEKSGPEQTEHLHRKFGASHFVHGAFDVVYREGGEFVKIDLQLRELPGGREIVRVTRESPEEQWLDSISEAARDFRSRLGATPLPAEREGEILAVVPADPGALKLYINGLAGLWKFDNQGALRAFSEAAALAPDDPLIQARLATAAENLGNLTLAYQASQKAYDRRHHLPRWLGLRVEALFHEIREHWEDAIPVYRELRKLFPRDPDYGLLLAGAQIFGGEPAFAVLEELREMPLSAAERVEVDLLEGEAHYYGGMLEPALEAAQRATRRAGDLGLRHQEARAHILAATLLSMQSQLAEAVAALKVAQRLLQIEPKNQSDLQIVFLQWAMDAYRLYGADATSEQFEILRQQFLERGDQVGVAIVQSSLGIVLTNHGAYSEAEDVLKDALKIFSRFEMRREVAVVANSLGAVHHYRGRFREAAESYLQALEIARDLGQQFELTTILTNLGELAFMEGDLVTARVHHDTALELNRELGALDGQAYDLFRLGKVRMARGETEDARELLEQSLDIYDDLYTADVSAPHQEEIRLALAELKLLEENFGDARKLARQAEQGFLEFGADGQAIIAQTVLARTFLDQDLAKAREFLDQARQNALTYQDEDRGVEVALAIVKARFAAREKDETALDAALIELESLIASVSEVPYLLELELALADAEMAAGLGERARSRLHAVLAEAEEKKFAIAAERAEKLLASSAFE